MRRQGARWREPPSSVSRNCALCSSIVIAWEPDDECEQVRVLVRTVAVIIAALVKCTLAPRERAAHGGQVVWDGRIGAHVSRETLFHGVRRRGPRTFRAWTFVVSRGGA